MNVKKVKYVRKMMLVDGQVLHSLVLSAVWESQAVFSLDSF
jgi:hypothetical protein